MKIKNVLKAGALCLLIAGSIGLSGCGNNDDANKGDDFKSQLAQEGKLIVGLDDTFAPMGFRDENGELVGFDIELAKEVGKELGVEVEFKPIAWASKELELKSKNIDCIWNGMSVTPEREKSMALSNKYLDNTIILMTEKGKDVKIAKEADLKKYKIATQDDSSALETMKRLDSYKDIEKNISTYPDYDKALLDLKAGRVDVIAIDQVLGEYKNTNLNGSLEVLEYKLGNDAYAIGFRKDDEKLRDAVNDALKKVIDNKKAEEISMKWFNKNIVIFESLNK